jgi:hypothetical protein
MHNLNLSTTADDSGDIFGGILVDFENTSTAGSQWGIVIQNASTSTADLDAGLYIDNADDTQVITDAIYLTSSGGGAITTGLNFADTDIVTDISLQNGELIENDTDGEIAFNLDGSLDLVRIEDSGQSGAILFIDPSSSAPTCNTSGEEIFTLIILISGTATAQLGINWMHQVQVSGPILTMLFTLMTTGQMI